MKKKIALILAVIMIISVCFVACSNNNDETEVLTSVQTVTDANGEDVTDENGEVVTEIVEIEEVTDEDGKTVTDSNGKVVTTVKSGSSSKNNNSSPNSNADSKSDNQNTSSNNNKDDSNDNTNNDSDDNDKKPTSKPENKPEKPDNVENLKTSDVAMDSVTLNWKSVKCTAYEISYSLDEKDWTVLEKEYKKTSYTAKKLTSYTKYYFRVRAYNKNDAGKSASNWATVEVTTTANENYERKLVVSVILPNKAGKSDTITVYIDGEKDGSFTAELDGTTYEYKTKEEYKGLVTVKVDFKDSGITRSTKTDKESVELDFSGDGIKILEGEDD